MMVALLRQAYESDSFRRLVSFLAKQLDGQLLSRRWLIKRVEAARVLRDGDLARELGGDKPFVVIMDGWGQQGAARGFEGIVVVWMDELDDGIELRRRVLDIPPRLYAAMDADALSALVAEAFAKYSLCWESIKDRCLCLVTDTASDVVATAGKLGVRSHACIDHVYNLALKDCEELALEIAEGPIETVSYFRKSSKRQLLAHLAAGVAAGIAKDASDMTEEEAQATEAFLEERFIKSKDPVDKVRQYDPDAIAVVCRVVDWFACLVNA